MLSLLTQWQDQGKMTLTSTQENSVKSLGQHYFSSCVYSLFNTGEAKRRRKGPATIWFRMLEIQGLKGTHLKGPNKTIVCEHGEAKAPGLRSFPTPTRARRHTTHDTENFTCSLRVKSFPNDVRKNFPHLCACHFFSNKSITVPYILAHDSSAFSDLKWIYEMHVSWKLLRESSRKNDDSSEQALETLRPSAQFSSPPLGAAEGGRCCPHRS